MDRRRTTAASAPSIWGRATVEGALRVGAGDLVRAAKRQHGPLWERWRASGDPVLLPVSAPATRGGVPDDEINATLALHGPRTAAALPTGQAVPLTMGRTGIGGLRFWWSCPLTGDRCQDLFLPDGAEWFASRQAHKLRYASLSESPAERAARRARALRFALGDYTAALGAPLPDRPPRMRPATHARLCAEIREAEAEALAVPASLLARADMV